MKKFRVTYKPYTQETLVEEYYEGASTEWEVIGGEDFPELWRLLHQNKTIQAIGEELLLIIENKNKKSEYSILFCGLSQDYYDFRRICEAHKFKNESVLKDIILETEFKKPSAIISALDEKLNEIENIYATDFSEIKDKLHSKIESCRVIEDAPLTILVVGMQNSGKSTLINSLIGKKILPVSGNVETAALYTVCGSNRNYIKIILSSNQSSEISVSDTDFTYEDTDVWLKNIIDDAKYSDENKSCTNAYERLEILLRLINNACKEQQTSKHNAPMIQEIEIGLKDYLHSTKGKGYIIKDLPGAGAKYLGDVHKEIINKTIRSINNAVTIYVLKFDSINDESAQQFLSDIKEYGCENSFDGRSRVDFERAIYVLNKADDAERPENEDVLDKAVKNYDEYKDRKWVLTCAQASLDFQSKGAKVSPSYKYKFMISEDGDSLLDLTQKCKLPASYEGIQEQLIEVPQNCSEEIANAIKRTGTPLVQGLIKDYADNAFSVHKVNCLYNAVHATIEVLNEQEQTHRSICEQRKQELEENREVIRDEIKAKITGARNDVVGEISKNIIKNSLTKEMKSMLDKFKMELLRQWIKDSRETEEKQREEVSDQKKQLKKSKKLSKDELKVHFDELEKTIKPWELLLTEKINDFLGCDVKKEIKDKAELIKISHISKLKKKMIDILRENQKTANGSMEEDIELIIKRIEEFYPEKETEFETPKFKWFEKVGAFFQFGEKQKIDFYRGKILVKFEAYYSEKIVALNADKLYKQISVSIDELNKRAQDDIGNLSPILIENQQQLDYAEHRLELLKGKISETKIIQNYCEKCYKEATI